MTEDLKYVLDKEIEEARGFLINPPPNEAATCNWVILPILLAIGYSKTDIIPQMGNAGNQFPDYTLLPNTSNTWYLEAKDWKQNLDSIPNAAIQALNYANTQGHRWVVLSNGREWILFDNHIQGVAVDERISARTDIKNPDFIDFISSLSKNSIQSGGLDSYSIKWRLQKILHQQLIIKDSYLVKAIQKVMKTETGLSNVQPTDITQYFAMLFEPENGNSVNQPPIHHVALTENTESRIYSLAELQDMGIQVRNHRVEELYLPDGKCLNTSRWCEAGVKIGEWIGNSNKLPTIPFRGLPSGKRWFINTSPFHDDGQKIKHRILLIGDKQLYMDVNRNSENFIKCLCNLCDASGVPKTDIKIKLTSKEI